MFCLNYLNDIKPATILAVFDALYKFNKNESNIVNFPYVRRYVSNGKNVLQLEEPEHEFVDNIIPFPLKRQ